MQFIFAYCKNELHMRKTAKKDGGDGECVPTKQREHVGKKLANMYRIECTELCKINKKKKFR